ncbi:MAG TPA: hypothetical protein DCX05_02285 [Prevotella sp.]|jgi:hypothetical protein|uniref:Uncharacterized protein n=1 Tax=Segatella copri TaxID=165179 RepID=A0A414YF61_9BACT|nr:hypothetical protein DW192_02140 [Segatella copri]HAW82797.1 hypothetical protein [Prevotella sp.]HBI99534.1 hypothetical protein [Prevotella sp.]HBJ03880.1 hypothetical protein [Prevotella sp.]
MIGQAMDFYLAGDSSPAIHSKTTAKVRKRIGICKKLFNFLANPKDIYHFKIIFSFEGWRNEKQLALSLFVKQKSHKLIMSIPITTS